jgi:hypothetical protein
VVRGIDSWISRGHERLDDDPPEVHPDDASQDDMVEQELAKIVTDIDQIDARIAKDVAAVAVLQTALVEMLRRIQRIEDETMGAALAARFDPDHDPHTNPNT